MCFRFVRRCLDVPEMRAFAGKAPYIVFILRSKYFLAKVIKKENSFRALVYEFYQSIV